MYKAQTYLRDISRDGQYVYGTKISWGRWLEKTSIKGFLSGYNEKKKKGLNNKGNNLKQNFWFL